MNLLQQEHTPTQIATVVNCFISSPRAGLTVYIDVSDGTARTSREFEVSGFVFLREHQEHSHPKDDDQCKRSIASLTECDPGFHSSVLQLMSEVECECLGKFFLIHVADDFSRDETKELIIGDETIGVLLNSALDLFHDYASTLSM